MDIFYALKVFAPVNQFEKLAVSMFQYPMFESSDSWFPST